MLLTQLMIPDVVRTLASPFLLMTLLSVRKERFQGSFHQNYMFIYKREWKKIDQSALFYKRQYRGGRMP